MPMEQMDVTGILDKKEPGTSGTAGCNWNITSDRSNFQ